MSKINGIGIGVSYGNSSGSGNLIDSSTFFAPLKTSLILQRGTGNPTWSRATKAWGFNELGYLEELASGCAFFGGARLVYNRLDTKSEDFSNAAWTKTVLTVSGTNTLVCNNSTATQRLNHATAKSLVTGQRIRFCVRAKKVAGGVSFIQLVGNSGGYGTGQFCNFSLNDGSLNATGCTATSTLVSGTTDTYDFTISMVSVADGIQDYVSIVLSNSISDTRLQAFIGDGVKSFELLRAWSVDVTNYDASYVPEYVSVGVESSPYFGAGIDGAKYFETDWQGAPIAAANLLGFRREAAAINNLRSCRDLRAGGSDTPWWKANTIEPELVTNGDFSADSGWVKGTGWTIIGGTANFASGTASRLTLAGVATIGKTYIVTFTIVSVSGSYVALELGSTSGPGSISSAGTYSIQLVCGTVDGHIGFYAPSGTTCVIDNVSVKEAAVQCTQATGLDGIANTATTLTATAADAIILQPTSGIASAARCASAYVKRRTGTGTISFTQDGGSTWTDITSLINSSTWSRVQITATLANPSVGFKISTSGDAIDVDCVQNEAGAVVTSPIVTTTAVVTRNADSLTYQTASNIDFAVGTIYGELQCSGSLVSRFAVEVGSATFQLSTPDANTDFRAYDTTLTAIKTGLSDITTGSRKRVVSWGPAGLSVTGDGLSPTTVAFDGGYGSGATISIGRNINGYIGPVAIYNYQMTDAELQAITT